MGVFVPLANGVQCELVGNLDGKVVSNRLWFTYDNPPFTVTEVQGLADGLAQWWTDWLLPLQSQDLFANVVVARSWYSDPPAISTISPVNLQGGYAGESSTANVAVVVPFRWPIGINLKRNKHYVPAIPEAEISLNSPSFFIRDGLFDAYVELIDATRRFLPVLNWRWVATSAYEDYLPRTEQLAYDVQGPYGGKNFKLGQRRRRLPLS